MSNINNYLILIFLCVFFCLASCSKTDKNGIPKLTQKEMKKDIDFLWKTIKDVNPHLIVREKVTNTPLHAQLDNLHKAASNIKTFEDFYYIVSRMLLLCQDQHDQLQTYYPEGIDENNNFYISTEAITISKKCSFLFDKYDIQRTIEAIYLDGKYFSPEKIRCSQIDTIPAGARILKVNNLLIDDYIVNWNRPIDQSVRWDFEHNKYYSYRIFPPYSTGLSDNFSITYQEGDSTKTVQLDDIGVEGWHMTDYSKAKVLYFENEHLFYIRIPEMNYQEIDFFKEKIYQYKNKNIKKVVIDIRYNGGGSDLLWEEIVAAIVDVPIITKEMIYIKNTPTVLDYMSKIRNRDLNSSPKSFLCIDNNYYIPITRELDTLSPAPISLNYSGKIYVLINEKCFSSSLAFTAFCNRTEKLVTVGQTTGYIGSRGITPFFFSLPNSKLIFQISPAIDATNVKWLEDYYDKKVKIPIKQSIDNYIIERKYTGERFGKDFLFNHDPVFQKVLELPD